MQTAIPTKKCGPRKAERGRRGGGYRYAAASSLQRAPRAHGGGLCPAPPPTPRHAPNAGFVRRVPRHCPRLPAAGGGCLRLSLSPPEAPKFSHLGLPRGPGRVCHGTRHSCLSPARARTWHTQLPYPSVELQPGAGWTPLKAIAPPQTAL